MLTDDILYLEAKLYMEARQFDSAVVALTEIKDVYTYDILADDAIFKLAGIYEEQYGDKEKAKELYQTIILDFKDSIYVTEARKRFRKLRGDNL